MNWNRYVARPALALAGFAATAAGSVTADRLSAPGADAGPADWLKVLALFAVPALALAARMALRAVDTPLFSVGGPPTTAAALKALGTQSAALFAAGDLPGAEAMLAAAKRLKGFSDA